MLFSFFQFIEPTSAQSATENVQDKLSVGDVFSLISILISLASAIICYLTLRQAFKVAKQDSRDHFETVVLDCLGSISVFIHDSYLILSENRFHDMNYIINGERNLLEGITRLSTYAQINKYVNLQEATTINFGDEKKNEKSFVFCFLDLEYRYMEYREKYISEKLNWITQRKVTSFHEYFRRYLRLFSEHLYDFKEKKRFADDSEYYKTLKKIKEEVEETYASKNNGKDKTKTKK